MASEIAERIVGFTFGDALAEADVERARMEARFAGE
jgi:hypothetical protein